MSLIHRYLFPAMWVGYLAYWWAMSTDVKVTERSESGRSRLIRLVSIVCAAALLSLPSIPLPFLNGRFLPVGAWCFWGGAAVTAGGLLFSVWARRHLGNNWSQAVTVKEGHELITSGPYGLVRHPIYTGLLLAFMGSAVARGEWRGLLAVALVSGALWSKLSLEEKWMRAQFGESYEAYSRQVAALVPHII
jgi:protein-S-isoprenylcysteine O-methyltransferase Ste14